MPKNKVSKKQEAKVSKKKEVRFPREPKHVAALVSTPAGKKRFAHLVAAFKKAKSLPEIEAIWFVELPRMRGKEVVHGLKPQVISYAFNVARGIPLPYGNTQMVTIKAIAKANPLSK